MTPKTLKTPKRGIAPKKTAKKAAPAVILVGTYKERQLAFIEREGVYNYPIGADDKLKPEDAAQVKELCEWLARRGRLEATGKFDCPDYRRWK